MTVVSEKGSNHPMSFYHENGLPGAWRHAMKYAGKKGRVATLPDIISARIGTEPGDPSWEQYFTTLTAEYLGLSKQGNRILIIAHGIGPMSTLDGIFKAYSWEFKDKARIRRGGRITQEEFFDLESGKFGKVEIVDFDNYCKRYNYPFLQILKFSEALTDPLLRARLGSEAKKYVLYHTDCARNWHREQSKFFPENKHNLPENVHERYLYARLNQHLNDGMDSSDPYIIQLEAPVSYNHIHRHQCAQQSLEEGQAIAHLLSIGGLSKLCHSGYESLTTDVACHGWSDGVRLVGIRPESVVNAGILPGPDPYQILKKHWNSLFYPVKNPENIGFRVLMKIDDQWFTQYPKKGESLDTLEQEYAVTSIREIGGPVTFKTGVAGYYGFFKYGINEMRVIAPPGANAYFITDSPENEWVDGDPKSQKCTVQFYRIEADLSKRIMRTNQLLYDFDKMMQLYMSELA